MSAVLSPAEENFRQMCKDDLPDVMAIENLAYQFPWTENIFADCMRAGYECWVIESESTIIGYMVFMLVAGECHLLNLCVHPNLQGQGYGRHALNKMCNVASEKQNTLVFLEVRPSNYGAINLYESAGFNQMGRRKNYYPSEKGREDAILFAKQL
jgi:ribosomal-protein-alanine N-acetyltransferase